MDIELTSPGKYVVAVSGGVDSAALLHVLHTKPGLDLVVAHFDHGIRPDSQADREFVEELAASYELPFIYAEGRLGPGASEAAARAARYQFLGSAQRTHKAQAIITAHHLDDVLETAIINLLRGGGRKGLTALSNRAGIERPLLSVPKSDIIAYAQKHVLQWREDSTNADTDYLRNYVRHNLLVKFDTTARNRLAGIIGGLHITNREIDHILTAQLAEQRNGHTMDRSWFIQLPHPIAKEAMAAWLRENGLRDFDRKTLERLVVAAKTAEAGKRFDVLRGTALAVDKSNLALDVAER